MSTPSLSNVFRSHLTLDGENVPKSGKKNSRRPPLQSLMNVNKKDTLAVQDSKVSQKQEKTTNSLMTQSSGASIASCCDDSLGDKKIDYTSGTSFANSSTYVHVYDVENRDEAPDDETDSDNAVFRVRHVWLEESDELNDLWTLKRANPVLDSSSSDDENDDEELYESPSKRLRAQKLRWEDEDEDGEPSLIDPARGRMVPS